MTEPNRITDDDGADALMPIMVELLKGFRHKKEAEFLQAVIDTGGKQRVLAFRLRRDLDFVALARDIRARDAMAALNAARARANGEAK